MQDYSPSQWVDGTFYYARNPDVTASGMDAVEHYMAFGRYEGRSPNALFDVPFYLAANPDVTAAGVDPLGHYLAFGWAEGRHPSAGFDTDFYLTTNPDVAASGMNPLAHYLTYGRDEGRRPLPPTFAATAEDGTVRFAGTATGDVGLMLEGATAIFTREGVEAMVADGDGIDAIALDGLTLRAEAPALSGKALTGGGTLVLTGIEADTDLSRVDGAVAVTVQVGADLDLSANAALGVVDAYEIADGATLTVSAAGAEAAAITGSYAIRDGVANLFDGASVRSAVAAAEGGVTVTGNASIAELTGLADAIEGALTYGSVADTAANLAPGGEAHALVAPGIGVEVTDAATLAQLAAIDMANGDGALAYGSVADTAANLAANAGGYVVAGNSVEVTGAATIAQLAAIDAANGDGALAYASVADALANLLVEGEAHPFVVPGTDVAATGEATVAQLAALDAANGDGALACTALTDTWRNILSDEAANFLAGVGTIKLSDYDLGQATVSQVQALLGLANLQDGTGDPLELADLAFTLSDTAANLASWTPMAAEIVEAAGAAGATDAATVQQAETIHERNAAAVYDIADAPYAIANGGADAVTAAVDLTATGAATAEQAVAIVGRDGPAGDVAFSIRDTFVNTDGIAAAVRDAATDIAVTTQSYGWPPYLTVAQAATVIGYGNGGSTEIEHIRGTAAEINAFVTANQETGGPSGLGYDFWVQDSPGAILAAIGDGSAGRIAFLTGNPAAGLEGDHRAANIEVAGSFGVADAETFWATVEPVFVGAETTSARTYYGIQDPVAAYDNESADGAPVVGADYLRVSDTAAHVHAAQNGLDAAHNRIFGLLDARQSGADGIYATGSSGHQYIRGTAGYDSIALGDGYDTAFGGDGGDVLDGGADNDLLRAGSGNDVVYGGAGVDNLHGEAGKDVMYAGASAADTVYSDARFRGRTAVTGGEGGDNMFGSVDFDAFRYEGSTRGALRAEAGTTQSARDYVTNFGLGDRIEFSAVGSEDVQFFGSGSANAADVEPGMLALSVRYEKNAQVLNWDGDGLVAATRVLVDVADGTGHFDDLADMQIILVGSSIDVNWDGSSLLFGG